MKAKELPPLEYLNECFELSDESPSGLIWKVRPREHFVSEKGWKCTNGRCAGKPAGTINYITKQPEYKFWQVRVGVTIYKVHRIVYSMSNEELIGVGEEVDHEDCNSLNNKSGNLRKSTRQGNQRNIRAQKNNFLGVKGISRGFGGIGFRARLRINGINKHLGTYPTLEEAHIVYCAAVEEHNGEFGRIS